MKKRSSSSGARPPGPGADVHPDLLPQGTVVGGFRLMRHVATGSYGSVWQVESEAYPGHRFALKFSLHGPGEGGAGDARAVREVQLLLRAAHENVVRVVAHGRWRHPTQGLHYLVMDWVEGGTLRQWAHANRPSARRVVRLCQKLARALQRAHEAGVLHRDVKPDNVLVSMVDDEPFLSDFGVGDAQGAPPLTLGAFPPGTLSFHSPQLLKSRLPGAAPYRAQPADDWYALGVLLYQLLTEVAPYPEHSEADELAEWVLRRKPVAPHELNPRVPPALGQVALTLLSDEPHLRFPHGQAVCAALEQALATAQDPEAPLLPPLPPPELTPTQPPSASDGFLARDEAVRDTHALKEEQDPEEARLEQVENRRDMLLQTRRQRRPSLLWRQLVRGAGSPWGLGVATALLLGALAGLWLGSWHTPPPGPPSPVAVLPAPPSVAPVATSAASPHLAPVGATSPKEGDPVKNPQSPDSSSPGANTPKLTAKKRRATQAALCAAGLLTVGCPGVPLRPTQKRCPPVVAANIKERKLEKLFYSLDPNSMGPHRVTVKPGPIIARVDKDEGKASYALLYGHVFFAEDGRVVVHYTELEFESGERVPLCHASVPSSGKSFDLDDVEYTKDEDNVVTARNSQIAKFVEVLPN
jgi:serine/threonine protein kinase